MQYRKVPKTDDRLSILGFGCMRFPEIKGKIDEEKSIPMLRHAIDAGINYLDTAWLYHNGQSETFLGKALKDGYREKVRLATKMPIWLVKNREDMDRFLDIQLNRLNTNTIDYYLLHALDLENWNRLKGLGIADFFTSAKKTGKISNAGFSFHADTTSLKAIVDDYAWEFCQIQYNILDEQNQAGSRGLEYAAAKGLAVMIMEPLRGGALAGLQPAEVQAVWDSAPVKRPPAEWALRWLWNRSEITVVLSGMSTDTQVIKNLNTASDAEPGSLTDDELEVIRKAADTYKKMMRVGCTGCRYCLPCPAGVDIPACFEIYNQLHLFKDSHFMKFMYATRVGGILGRPASASLCKRCGICTKSCPQQIPIPDRLSEVTAEFEGIGFRIFVIVAKVVIPLQRWLGLRLKRG